MVSLFFDFSPLFQPSPVSFSSDLWVCEEQFCQSIMLGHSANT